MNMWLKMKRYIPKDWPLIVSVIIFGVLLMYLLIQSLNLNQGHLIYTLDDPYIHMAISKNFAHYGVWGVTQHGFTSTSSSLLWTIVISLIYLIGGVNEIIPFILNIIFTIGALSMVYIILNEFKISKVYILMVLILIIFLTPLPALVFTGMEHIMHIFLVILFIYLSVLILVKDKEGTFKYLLVLAFLLIMTRYESIFLIITVSFLFFMKKNYLYSISLTAVSLIPLGVYGLISILEGWYFLPNSIVLKSIVTGNQPFLSKIYFLNIFNHFIDQMFHSEIYSEILVLFLISSIFLLINLFNRRFKDLYTVMLFIFISITFLHLLFANVGWFYRYEAYLVFTGIFINSIVIYQFLYKNKINIELSKILRYSALMLLLCLIVIPLGPRYISFSETPVATHNIYEQQYQMGLFIKQFYNNESIALNDVGAVNYLADVKCTDVYGLSNMDVARAKKGEYYTPEELSGLLKNNNIKVIIIYDKWFKNMIPSDWIKVSDWEILNNIVCGDNKVSFYVRDPKDKEDLLKNIKIFSTRLPDDVKVTIYE